MVFEALFFDLDDTLYPSTSGIWEAIGERMNRYMIDVLGFKQAEVAGVRDELFHTYGTTFRGLRTVYDIDPYAFLDFVHDLPLENYIHRNEVLVHTLNRIPGRKLIFTNASHGHAERVIDVLGLDGCFEKIIDIMQIDPYSKPFPEAYQRALELAGGVQPTECVVLDDMARNLITAHELGFFTIQVGTDIRAPFVDAALLSIVDLEDVIPLKNELSETSRS